ncbi:hypothetical protein BKH42_03620 [Helicobacter sp. 13S00482-2]|uniref:TraV family lipoprotein n=1 Tax=Helicobacter sp. 13S00482-2 TaxID=1476200 RepID=UPI000BA754CE|nr:TraV family lipoprotein [Helicobacter sp. 13S00482-2]PAF53830.1 hypothetical protein BKH42_03620 [Helicobacter sp. 13S00482-2]
MRRKLVKINMFIFGFFFLLTGCSQKEIRITLDQQVYSPRYKPIIGSGNNDARTIIDYGVVLKIWVTPYKDTEGTLIAAHYEYVWVDRPDFVPGSAVPQISGGGGVITPTGKLPFSISPNEIDRSDIKSDQVINRFNIQSSKNTNSRILQRAKKEDTSLEVKKKQPVDPSKKQLIKQPVKQNTKGKK